MNKLLQKDQEARELGGAITKRSNERGAMEKPSWADLLEPKGVYYKGIVDDPNSLVEKLTADTVTTFGTRRSRQLHSCQDKENQTQVSKL